MKATSCVSTLWGYRLRSYRSLEWLDVLTAIIYGFDQDGEWGYELIVSRDDGQTWQSEDAIIAYNPGRRISGRGWPRTVQLDANTLGTLFYDLDKNQPGGPGIFL